MCQNVTGGDKWMVVPKRYPLELYERLEGGGCRFWGLNHEMLLIEMLERGRIGSPDAWSEIEPWGKSGMQAHFLASRQA